VTKIGVRHQLRMKAKPFALVTVTTNFYH